MNEANKVKLGAFVLISALLLIAAFIAAGALRVFSPRIHAMTEVHTSVEGLAVGSPVKYLGMPVGKVTGMHMRGSDGRIIIFFDIFGKAFKDDLDPKDSDGVFDRFDLEKMLERQMLSCFVNASGLMGGSHLELVREQIIFPKRPTETIKKDQIPPDVSYIPSNPSHIGNAIQNVSRMLEEMKSIDWNGFAEKLNSSLDNLNVLLNKQDLEAALKRFERISTSLEKTASRLENVVTQQNIDNMNFALNNFNQSTRNLLEVSSSKEVKETVNNLNAFLKTGKSLLDKTDNNARTVHAELKTFLSNLETSLIRLENNITGISSMLQDFSKDPGQVIHGRKEPNL